MQECDYLKALKVAGKAIEDTAAKEGESPDYVRKQIMDCIREGIADPDPRVQSAWSSIPRSGEIPTPEELLAWVACRVLSGPGRGNSR